MMLIVIDSNDKIRKSVSSTRSLVANMLIRTNCERIQRSVKAMRNSTQYCKLLFNKPS